MSCYPGPMNPDDLLASADAAQYLGITRQSLHNLASSDPDFPPPKKRYGRTPVWAPEDLDAWRQQHPARKQRGS